ncbi:MAG: YcxB family protein [Oscillospiraceae bacterium]|jgi:hypothetical protein|nr:YcxB family protein [Oscillospiraceae bacterium]
MPNSAAMNSNVTTYFKNTLQDVKISTKVYRKYILETKDVLIYAVSASFLALSILQYVRSAENITDPHRTLFQNVPHFLFVGLLFLISVYSLIMPKYFASGVLRKYKTSPYKNQTWQLSGTREGIIVANRVHSTSIQWSNINSIIERSEGFYILHGESFIVLPARFLNREQVISLYSLFETCWEGKLMKISEVKLPVSPERSEKLEMLPLYGSAEFEFFARSNYIKYKKMKQKVLSGEALQIVIFISPILLVCVAMIIFMIKYVISALMLIALAVAVALMCWHWYTNYKCKLGFEERHSVSQRHVTLYDNAMVFEYGKLILEMEYKYIEKIQELDDEILVSSKSGDYFTIPCGERKHEVVDFINLKTL